MSYKKLKCRVKLPRYQEHRDRLSGCGNNHVNAGGEARVLHAKFQRGDTDTPLLEDTI